MTDDSIAVEQRQVCTTTGCERLIQRGCSGLCRKCADERRLSQITDICLGFIPGQCKRTVTRKAHQLCSPCYEQFRTVFRKTPYLCAFAEGCKYPRRHQVPRPADPGLCIIHDEEYAGQHVEPPILKWCEAQDGHGEPCGRLAKNSSQPWCSAHYNRWKKHGDVMDDVPIQILHPRGTIFCSYINEDTTVCGDVAIYTSDPPWCARHYAANNRPEKTGKCPECGKSILETSDRCQPCYVKNRTGPNHPNWKGGGKHGRTAAELQEMFTKQNGLCAACEEAESSKIHGVSRSLSVDHDHDHCDGPQSCGECVRELLCSRCNHVIGFAKDSVPVLEHCIEYLVKWDKTGERLPQLLAWAHEIIDRYES